MGKKLLDDVVVPGLVPADPLVGVAPLGGDRLRVNGVHGEELKRPSLQIVREGLDHTEIFPVEEAPVLTGNRQNGLSAVAVDLELHVPAQETAVFLVIFHVHGGSSFGAWFLLSYHKTAGSSRERGRRGDAFMVLPLAQAGRLAYNLAGKGDKTDLVRAWKG